MDELVNEVFQENLLDAFSSDQDPSGSYTGTCPVNPYAVPEQDADDL